MNEGFLQDLLGKVKGSKDKEYVNKGKEYLDSLPKQFLYNGKKFSVSWGTPVQQKFGELGTVRIWPDKSEDIKFFAYCEDPLKYNDYEKWEFIISADDQSDNTYYKYRSKGWYLNPAKGTDDSYIEFDMNEIAKQILLHSTEIQKESEIHTVVMQILEGADIRTTIAEAYKTANFVQANKDLKNKSDGIKSDYATLLTQEQYNKYKSLLHKHPLDFTGWLKDGNSPDIGKFDIKLLAYPLAVQPVIHLSSVGELKQGDTFEYGGVDFVLLGNDFAISVSPIGKSEFRKEFDNDVDAKDYEKSDVKKFVDNWFNKIKI